MRLIPTGGDSKKAETVKGHYELWKDIHPDGTVEQFLESLKPAPDDNVFYLQSDTPTSKKFPYLWLQVGMGPDGKGITLNLVRKKENGNP